MGEPPTEPEDEDEVAPPQRTKSWEDTWAEQGADVARQQVRRHDAATRLQAVQRREPAEHARPPRGRGRVDHRVEHTIEGQHNDQNHVD